MTSEIARSRARKWRKGRPVFTAVAASAVLVLLSVIWLALALIGEEDAAVNSAATAYSGTPLEGEAPDFTLANHLGQPVTLSGLRGRPVVLAFMDTRCTDTCPLTALEFRAAHEKLGADRGNVAFLAVNVNAKHSEVSDALSFTNKYQLGELSRWHFLTGKPDELRAVWSAYQIGVEEIPGKQEFQHTPGVYIIDAEGKLRWYVSTPLSQDDLAAGWNGPILRDILVAHIQQLLKEER